MFGLSKLYIYAGAFVLVAGALWWAIDTIGDAREAKLRLEAAEGRTEGINDSRRIENDVRNESDDSLLDALLGRLSGAAGDEPSVQGHTEEAAEGE